MMVGDLCNREVISTTATEPVRQAARRMRRHHVGELIVVDGRRAPIGVVTDRDLVVGALAGHKDIDQVHVGDVMSRNPVMAHVSQGLDEALDLMRSRAIRRLPVVDGEGRLEGILTLDDVLAVVSGELSKMVQLVMREQLREKKDRRPL